MASAHARACARTHTMCTRMRARHQHTHNLQTLQCTKSTCWAYEHHAVTHAHRYTHTHTHTHHVFSRTVTCTHVMPRSAATQDRTIAQSYDHTYARLRTTRARMHAVCARLLREQGHAFTSSHAISQASTIARNHAHVCTRAMGYRHARRASAYAAWHPQARTHPHAGPGAVRAGRCGGGVANNPKGAVGCVCVQLLALASAS